MSPRAAARMSASERRRAVGAELSFAARLTNRPRNAAPDRSGPAGRLGCNASVPPGVIKAHAEPIRDQARQLARGDGGDQDVEPGGRSRGPAASAELDRAGGPRGDRRAGRRDPRCVVVGPGSDQPGAERALRADPPVRLQLELLLAPLGICLIGVGARLATPVRWIALFALCSPVIAVLWFTGAASLGGLAGEPF